MIAAWPAPAGREEYAAAFDNGHAHRVLVLPALFDEANKLRHFTIRTMRRLSAAGVDCLLPDLPGCNESLAPLEEQDLDAWRSDASAAARHFGATHVLCLRGGALIAPEGVGGWAYAPASGASLLATLLRARVLSAREAGREENRQQLLDHGIAHGIELAGYRLGPAMVAQLREALPASHLAPIAQNEIGGAGLWLRAEPACDTAQEDALASLILAGLGR